MSCAPTTHSSGKNEREILPVSSFSVTQRFAFPPLDHQSGNFVKTKDVSFRLFKKENCERKVVILFERTLFQSALVIWSIFNKLKF